MQVTRSRLVSGWIQGAAARTTSLCKSRSHQKQADSPVSPTLWIQYVYNPANHSNSTGMGDYDLQQSLEPTSLVSALPNELQTIQVFRANECFASGSKNTAAQLASTKHLINMVDQDCLAFDAQLEGIGNLNSSFVLHDVEVAWLRIS